MRILLVALFALIGVSGVSAESRDIRLGWMNIQPCSELVTNNGFPYVKTADQELVAYLRLNAPDVNAILGFVNHCAFNVALPATTLAAIFASPGAAQPTFFGLFNTCMAAQNWSSMSLFVDSECMW